MTHRPPAPARPRRWRPSIALALVFGFGGLVAAAVAAVLLVSLDAAQRNTYDLLRGSAELNIDQVVQGLDRQLGPAQSQVTFLAKLLSSGAVPLEDEARLKDLLLGSLAAAPQIAGVAYVNERLYAVRAGMDAAQGSYVAKAGSFVDRPEIRLAIRNASTKAGLTWGEIFYIPEEGNTYISLYMPVQRGDEFRGIVAAIVSISGLSDALANEQGPIGARRFVLRGKDEVLVHPALAGGPRGLSADKPLLHLSEIGDPVLAAIWSPPVPGNVDEILAGSDVQGRIVKAAGDEYVVLYRQVTGYGAQPWLVGIYYRLADVNEPVRRIVLAGLVGAGILAAAVLVALLLGRSLTRPIRRLAMAAEAVRGLDFHAAAPLPGSSFRELDVAAQAYNSMIGGLRWFETYVPKSLVLLLLRQGEAVDLASDEREITVLFTDIVGFTAIGERLAAPQLADFLNRHFALLGGSIEAAGGTIDKYIGDSVMAFWGAPGLQPDHAERACRAALAIAAAIRADNERRRAKDIRPVRLRIGIHTGPAIVGNIGAPGRINYTLIGDTVNMAQRLEQLGKSVDTGAEEVIALISAATAAALPPDIVATPLGAQHLRGTDRELAVFRLV